MSRNIHCRLCERNYTKPEYLSNHYCRDHRAFYNCYHCTKHFQTEDERNAHIGETHAHQPLRCYFCHCTISGGPNAFFSHLQQEHPSRVHELSCTLCPYIAHAKWALGSHVRYFHHEAGKDLPALSAAIQEQPQPEQPQHGSGEPGPSSLFRAKSASVPESTTSAIKEEKEIKLEISDEGIQMEMEFNTTSPMHKRKRSTTPAEPMQKMRKVVSPPKLSLVAVENTPPRSNDTTKPSSSSAEGTAGKYRNDAFYSYMCDICGKDYVSKMKLQQHFADVHKVPPASFEKYTKMLAFRRFGIHVGHGVEIQHAATDTCRLPCVECTGKQVELEGLRAKLAKAKAIFT